MVLMKTGSGIKRERRREHSLRRALTSIGMMM